MALQSIEVRLFTPEEWPLYKQIRLKALQSDPIAFGASYEQAALRSDADWQQRVQNPRGWIFGVFHRGEIIGMTGVDLMRDDASAESVILWGSWIEPKFRGLGIAAEMYRVRIDHARGIPGVRRIVVAHRASNLASMRANQKHGFVFTHAKMKRWPDGVSEPDLFYQLEL